MSTPISNLNKDHQALMTSIRRRNEKEVENTDLTHQNLIQEKRNQLEKNLDFEIQKNDSNITFEAQRTEEALQKLKKNLSQTQEYTDKELTKLKRSASAEKIKTLENLSEDKQRFYQEHDNQIVEINDTFNLRQADLNRLHDLKSREQKYGHEREEINLNRKNQQKIKDIDSQFHKKFRRNEEAFNQTLTKQKSDLDKGLMKKNVEHHQQINKLSKEYDYTQEKNRNQHEHIIKDLNSSFEKRYALNQTKNEEEFLKANQRKEVEVNKLKEAVQKEALKIDKKENDPFFSFTKLSPNVEDLGTSVQIKVQVPEYAKNEMLLTINHKTAILTLNRRYSDETKDERSNVNKINRIESFVSKVETGAILNPKKIDSHYSNGLMTYTIQKA